MRDAMIHFFSNHKDTSAIETLTGEPCTVIPHPYIEPEWSVEEIQDKCATVIQQALDANELVINGDYTLVSIIVLARHQAGKKTGFVAMKKLNAPSSEKDEAGNIIHRNVLKPVAIRWV